MRDYPSQVTPSDEDPCDRLLSNERITDPVHLLQPRATACSRNVLLGYQKVIPLNSHVLAPLCPSLEQIGEVGVESAHIGAARSLRTPADERALGPCSG